MKSLLFIFSTLLVLPLGNEPLTVTTTLSKDIVWAKTIDFFTKQGIAIKTIDKTSGIIQSDKLGLGTHTITNNQPPDSTAWAICTLTKHDYIDKAPIYPTGELFISVQENNGNTTIAINLLNLQAIHSQKIYKSIYYDQYNTSKVQTGSEPQWSPLQSTKVLEKQVAKMLLTDTETAPLQFDSFGTPIEKSAQISQAQIQANKNGMKRILVFTGLVAAFITVLAVFFGKKSTN